VKSKSWCALMVLLPLGVVLAGWREGGKPVPDTPWRKSADDFGAMLMLTDDPEGFFEQWNRPPSPDYKPQISKVEETRRGANVASLVLFIGCKPDDEGNCDVDADYRILRPDGSVYGERKGAEVWRGRTAPPAEFLQVGADVFGMNVDPDDPFGTYVFEAKVRDNHAKVKVELRQEVRVVESKQAP
jgi:hypothetical protein